MCIHKIFYLGWNEAGVDEGEGDNKEGSDGAVPGVGQVVQICRSEMNNCDSTTPTKMAGQRRSDCGIGGSKAWSEGRAATCRAGKHLFDF